MFKIEWPSEVTPTDIAKIDKLRAEGKSLGAAVSWFIVNEAKFLAQPPHEETNQNPDLENEEDPIDTEYDTWLEEWQRKHYAAVYATPACVVLEAESVIKGEPSIMEELIAQINDQPLNETSLSNSSLGLIMMEVEWEFLRTIWGQRIKASDPLRLVDDTVSTRIKLAHERELNGRSERRLIEAAEAGRQRFHKLYQVSTEQI